MTPSTECVVFSDTELDQLSEFIRMAQQSLLEALAKLALVHPTSPLVERLTIEVEQAADLRERIEAR